MMWFQLTANTGPVECCLGVRKALAVFMEEAKRDGVMVDVIEEIEPSPEFAGRFVP